jgi:hypothetical protein
MAPTAFLFNMESTMKTIATALVLGACLMFVSTQSVLAQGMASAMMPKCASGDPVVGVNMTTKMYMTQAQMKAKSAGMTAAQKQAMMKKNNVKLMCKSDAASMGAKPMTAPPM